MILIVCAQCHKGLRVSAGDVTGEVSEAEALFGSGSELYPDAYPCFNCGEFAALVEASDSEAILSIELHEVTPQEAFAAMHGLGLPAEQDCGAAAVERALLSSPVRRVRGRPIRNSHRSILETIELEDGTTLYLGASAYGATVYRISKPHSYTQAVTSD